MCAPLPANLAGADPVAAAAEMAGTVRTAAVGAIGNAGGAGVPRAGETGTENGGLLQLCLCGLREIKMGVKLSH